MSQFAAVQGNLGLLALLLAFSWTLGAIGEEVAYRGFLLTRLQAGDRRQAGRLRAAIVIAAVAAALPLRMGATTSRA